MGSQELLAWSGCFPVDLAPAELAMLVASDPYPSQELDPYDS